MHLRHITKKLHAFLLNNLYEILVMLKFLFTDEYKIINNNICITVELLF